MCTLLHVKCTNILLPCHVNLSAENGTAVRLTCWSDCACDVTSYDDTLQECNLFSIPSQFVSNAVKMLKKWQ